MESRGEVLSGRRALGKGDVFGPLAKWAPLVGASWDGKPAAVGDRDGWRAQVRLDREMPALCATLEAVLEDTRALILKADEPHRGPVRYTSWRPHWSWLRAEMERCGVVRVSGSYRPAVWRAAIAPRIEVWGRASGLTVRRHAPPGRGERPGEEWREVEMIPESAGEVAWVPNADRAGALLVELIAMGGVHASVSLAAGPHEAAAGAWWTDLRPKPSRPWEPSSSTIVDVLIQGVRHG